MQWIKHNDKKCSFVFKRRYDDTPKSYKQLDAKEYQKNIKEEKL
jgi:hypothetical protein